MEGRLYRLLNRIMETDVLGIVCCGRVGIRLLGVVKEIGFHGEIYLMDNSEHCIGNKINGIEVKSPHIIKGKNSLYVIANNTRKVREDIRQQLLDLGGSNIEEYYSLPDKYYFKDISEVNYKDELLKMCKQIYGDNFQIDNPHTYNEKINWEKLNIHDPRRTLLSDKYRVREWIKEKLGEQYLTKLYGVYDEPTEIDFDSLPKKFVLKVNHMSGTNILVQNKDNIDKEAIIKKLQQYKNENHAYNLLELHYRDIKPVIICEEYLEGVAETLYDYDVYCFHGKPKYIWCINGSHRVGCKATFYTTKWEPLPFSFGYPKDPVLAPKPEILDDILKLSSILANDFEHVRVDWMIAQDGRLIFSEMTFSTWGGVMCFIPEEWDKKMGDLI